MIVLDIPGSPPRELSPNARIHWRPRVRIKNEWAKLWRYAALDAMGAAGTAIRFEGPVRLRVTYLKGKGAQSHDLDNLTAILKGGIDALQEAGLLANDRQIVGIEVEQVRSPDGIGRTRVEIEEVPQP